MNRPIQFTLIGGQELAKPTTRRYQPAQGYAAAPGTGPAGEACASCAHCRARKLNGNWRVYKCVLLLASWDRTRATDILLRSPACSRWQSGEPRTSTAQPA